MAGSLIEPPLVVFNDHPERLHAVPSLPGFDLPANLSLNLRKDPRYEQLRQPLGGSPRQNGAHGLHCQCSGRNVDHDMSPSWHCQIGLCRAPSVGLKCRRRRRLTAARSIRDTGQPNPLLLTLLHLLSMATCPTHTPSPQADRRRGHAVQLAGHSLPLLDTLPRPRVHSRHIPTVARCVTHVGRKPCSPMTRMIC